MNKFHLKFSSLH